MLGCSGKDGDSQSLGYIYGDSKILINGGEISGLTCFYGTYEHTLTWEDLAKVYMTGKELEIDPWMNCICMK